MIGGTAPRPYTGATQLLGTRRSPTAPRPTYSLNGDGAPDPRYPWYHAPLTPDTPTVDPRYPPNGNGGGTPPAAAPASTDPYANDPIYQQIVAMANTSDQQAEAASTASQKQLAIELGDPGLAAKLHLGQQVADTAQANPFSTLKNLLRGHNANATAIDQGDNKANLYYSSTRARGQQQEQTGYQGNIAGAEGAAQTRLSEIASILLAAHQADALARANAAADAYGRAKTATPVLPPGVDADLYAKQLAQIAAAQALRSGQPADTSSFGGGSLFRLFGG